VDWDIDDSNQDKKTSMTNLWPNSMRSISHSLPGDWRNGRYMEAETTEVDLSPWRLEGHTLYTDQSTFCGVCKDDNIFIIEHCPEIIEGLDLLHSLLQSLQQLFKEGEGKERGRGTYT
jgi:type II secretory pathway component PulJ